jgi:hypothetical protein
MYQISLELIAKYQPRCNEEKYDRAWDNRWVGDYTSSLTAPLRPRGPHEDPI